MTAVVPVTVLCRVVVLLLVSKYVVSQRGVECPRVQRPWNGETIGTCQRFVGAQCTFTCRTPYVVRGSHTRTCQADGTWSGQIAYCELEHCPNCDNNNNNNNNNNNIRCSALVLHPGSVTDGRCTGEVGTSCTFRCTNNLPLDGQPVLVCLPSGVWSGQPPICRGVVGHQNDGRCPTLNAPAGGRLVGSCSVPQVGDTCQLVCISGYRPSDTRILVCQQNGAWSDSLPTCIGGVNVQCPNIAINQGGTTSGNCSPGVPGQTCTVTCYPGYTISGPGTIICQSSGSWSGNIPTCNSASCPTLNPPPNGVASNSCNGATTGQTCIFTCQPGFTLVGQPVLVCQSGGRWSGQSPSCVAAPSCPTLITPANGAQSGSCGPATAGQACTFSCQPGYTLTGQSTLYCQAGGSWSGNPPTCTASACPTLNSPANGGQFGSCVQATVGQTCTFSCQSGFTLVGSATLVCQPGGTWSSSAPYCSRATTSCPNLYSPDNGYIIGTCSPGQPGQTCTFGCQNGYYLQGSSILTCQSSGTWSSLPPTCEGRETESNCPTLVQPANGEFIECDNRPGGRCVVVCQRGFLRSGSRVRTCLPSGVWSGFAPICERKGFRMTSPNSLIIIRIAELNDLFPLEPKQQNDYFDGRNVSMKALSQRFF